MSAPDVSLERQKRRHRTIVKGLWVGVTVAVIVAVMAFFFSIIIDSDTAYATPVDAVSSA